MDTIFNLVSEGFANILNLQCFLLLCGGVLFGAIFGCIPGLTTTIAIAVALPFSYNLQTFPALSLLMGTFVGGISGGCISAILIGIPGTAGSVATVFDGNPMAQKGEAGKALAVAIFYSFMGTLFGFVCLITMAPLLARLGLMFGYYEFFALIVFAFTIIAALVSGNILKGLASTVLGMAMSVVGLSALDGAMRFTFGFSYLADGFTLLTFTIGFYAFVSLMETAESKGKEGGKVTVNYKIKGFGFSFKEFKDNLWNFFRSALIGLSIGILPGIGANVSNLVAYSMAKSQSRYPEKFGTGIMDGVVAPEAANNATIGGAILPMITLGIPGDANTALLIGALMVKNIMPGPMIFASNADAIYSIYALLFLGSFVMLLIVRSSIPFFVKLLDIPAYMLLPVIVFLGIVGVYCSTKSVLDIWVCISFGIAGYFMKQVKIPIGPMVVAFILTPLLEINLRRGLMKAPNRSFLDFFSSPIFTVLMILTVLVVAYSVFDEIRKAKAAKWTGVKVDEEEKD
jgi:putative tricarboxylic transport membrane protein